MMLGGKSATHGENQRPSAGYRQKFPGTKTYMTFKLQREIPGYILCQRERGLAEEKGHTFCNASGNHSRLSVVLKRFCNLI